jgi:hypothetical protein
MDEILARLSVLRVKLRPTRHGSPHSDRQAEFRRVRQ